MLEKKLTSQREMWPTVRLGLRNLSRKLKRQSKSYSLLYNFETFREKKIDFKDQLFEETRKQAELKQKLVNLEDDKMTLEQQIETGFKIGNNITAKAAQNQAHDVNLARHKMLLEQKARKEREDIKRQLLVGLEYSGGQREDLRVLLAQ